MKQSVTYSEGESRKKQKPAKKSSALCSYEKSIPEISHPETRHQGKSHVPFFQGEKGIRKIINLGKSHSNKKSFGKHMTCLLFLGKNSLGKKVFLKKSYFVHEFELPRNHLIYKEPRKTFFGVTYFPYDFIPRQIKHVFFSG